VAIPKKKKAAKKKGRKMGKMKKGRR